MKFSLNHIKKLVDLSNISDQEIIDRLTFSGFEVEDVVTLAKATNLVVGQIVECVNHPKSDHLHLLKVDCGSKYGIKDIVCGAKNARTGLKVIVATVGARLDAIDATIKESTILGYPSSGMCCSLVELGVDKSLLSEKQINGIEELDENMKVGSENVLELLHLDDTILDINVLPNRLDCLSYFQMAREIAALFNRKIKFTISSDISSILNDSRKVTSDTELCNSISLLYVKNIKGLKKTSEEVKSVLLSSGIRSISPIVDLGNYIMLMTGQPINMYDLNKLDGDVKVTSSYDGKFKSFDEKEYDLKSGDILIEDSKKPLCLAGIIASDTAMINDESDSIAIEFASFYHANIRRTSKRLGLSSYSSQLFAKGVNELLIDDVIFYTISILDEFFTSYDKLTISKYQRKPIEKYSFNYSLTKTNSRLGSDYNTAELLKLLELYNISYDRLNENEFVLYPPKYRLDLKEQCDIDEELFRYYGAKRIPLNLNDFPISKGEMSSLKKEINNIRSYLINRGFLETVSYTLIDEKKDNLIRIFNDSESYKIINPMTKDHEIVRSDLLPSLLETIEYNVNHFNKDFALFEFSSMCINTNNNANPTYLSLALVGNKLLQDNYQSRLYDFYDMKAVVINILNKLGLNPNRYSIVSSTSSCFNPYCSADIMIGKNKVCSFGKIHPSLSDENIIMMEMDFSAIVDINGRVCKYKPVADYPLIRRDLSFLVNDDTTFLDIKNTILKTKDPYIKDVLFFDEFTSIDKKKYLGVSLYMSKEDSSLSENEINSSFNKAIDAVSKNLGLTIRK